MGKKFKAWGILYSEGDKLGLSETTLTEDVMLRIVKGSPASIPVVDELSRKRFLTDPNHVIGHATIDFYDAEGPKPPYITCCIVFNAINQRKYEEMLQSKSIRDRLRFGFLLSRITDGVVNGRYKISDGRITAVSLNTIGLGSGITRFGWEEE